MTSKIQANRNKHLNARIWKRFKLSTSTEPLSYRRQLRTIQIPNYFNTFPLINLNLGHTGHAFPVWLIDLPIRLPYLSRIHNIEVYQCTQIAISFRQRELEVCGLPFASKLTNILEFFFLFLSFKYSFVLIYICAYVLASVDRHVFESFHCLVSLYLFLARILHWFSF